MISGLFRWIYHARQNRAARRRLAGKTRTRQNWHRFSYNVFRRARSDSRNLRDLPTRWVAWGLGLPLGLFALWFVWQSIEAIGMFQP